MMISCVFDRATGVFVGGHRDRAHEFDPTTQVRLDLEQWPDRVSERWDGANGVRLATPQELGQAEEERKDRLADNLDDLLLAFVKALNKGTFMPGSRYTRAQIKAIIKAEL